MGRAYGCTISRMPNIAQILKSEISRVARKEIRNETLALKKSVAGYRTEIAALKRRTQALERQLNRVQRGAKGTAPPSDAEEGSSKQRFSAKGLASQRARLALSAVECGLLVGASSQSVYNWEQGKSRPLARHLPAIAAIRKMGKREAAARLAALQG